MKNGERIELFDALDLDNLSLAKNKISDIEFVLNQEAEAAEKTAQTIQTFYRGIRHSDELWNSDGGWFSSKQEVSEGYGANIFKGQVDTSSDKIYKIDALGAIKNEITWLGDGTDEVSKRMIYLRDRISEVEKEICNIEDNHSTDGWIDYEYEDEFRNLKTELLGIRKEYNELDKSKDNIYGTHDIKWFRDQSEALGYSGLLVKNVKDLNESKAELLSEGDNAIADSLAIFDKKLVDNIQQVAVATYELADAKKKVSQHSNETPVLYEEASGQLSMFEQEAEAKRKDAEATKELTKAQKEANTNPPTPPITPGQMSIDDYTNGLQKEEQQARSTAEAVDELTEAEERHEAVINTDHVYKNQSGEVTSGNYSYNRYGEKPNLAEKYHGVVTTDEDGNTQAIERLIVDYDKLLSEILKYDAQIYKIQQDINNAQGDTTGLEKKKGLIEGQLKDYTDLMQRIVSEPEFVTNADQQQLDYIQKRRDLQTEILKADTLIAQTKQDEANKQNAINAQIKIQEDAYRQMWELRTKINLADKSEDPAKISDWKNKLSTYKNIYDNATQTLKQLDAQVAKEQELVSLVKIRGEIVSKYDSERASRSDKTRAENIAASVQKERAAYKELWDIRKQIAKIDPDKDTDGQILKLEIRAKRQEDIYKAEMQTLQALDQDKAKEEALNNILNVRKKTVQEIKDIQSTKSNRDVDSQVNSAVAAQKRIGALQGLKYRAEQNPYIDNNDPVISAMDTVISKYQDEVDAVNKLNLTKEQEQKLQDALAESKLAYAKAVAKVTEETNRQTEAGKKQDQQLDSTRASLQKQASALTANGKLMKVYGDQVNALLEEIKNPTTTLERLNAIRVELNKISAEATVAGQSGKTLFQILKQRATSLMAYLGTFASFYRIVGYIRQAFSTLIDLDTQLVDLRKTTSMTTSELNQFYMSSSDVAKGLGVTTSEIISQAAAWSRLGYSTKEASTEMAKLSSKFASVSPGMTTENATDYLVSTMQAYGIAVDDVERKVMDNVNRIGNTFATTNAEIGEMLTRSSAAMNAANNSLEETIALESAAVEVTRNAEMTGTAFRTVSMRIRGLDEETEEALEDYEELKGKIADLTKTKDTPGGVSLFTDATKTEYKSTYQFLKDIAAVYDQISDKNQAALLEAIGGKRGAQSLAPILSNFDEVERAMKEMEGAAGSADKEMDIIRDKHSCLYVQQCA